MALLSLQGCPGRAIAKALHQRVLGGWCDPLHRTS